MALYGYTWLLFLDIFIFASASLDLEIKLIHSQKGCRRPSRGVFRNQPNIYDGTFLQK